MSHSITDVKELIRTDDIKEANSKLSSGNWILVDTHHAVPDLEFPNDVLELFILGRIK